jgi:hypothetical protein
MPLLMSISKKTIGEHEMAHFLAKIESADLLVISGRT